MAVEHEDRVWLSHAVIDALIHAKRVAIFSEIHQDSRSIFKQIKEHLERADVEHAVDRICSTNGRERIDLCNGGRLIFYSLRQVPYRAVRGSSLDIVYRPEQIRDEERFNGEVLPALTTSKDARIVAYNDLHSSLGRWSCAPRSPDVFSGVQN